MSLLILDNDGVLVDSDELFARMRTELTAVDGIEAELPAAVGGSGRLVSRTSRPGDCRTGQQCPLATPRTRLAR